MQDSDDVTPDQILARLKSNRLLVGIPLAALVADLLVRTQSNFELSIILPFEAVYTSGQTASPYGYLPDPSGPTRDPRSNEFEFHYPLIEIRNSPWEFRIVNSRMSSA